MKTKTKKLIEHFNRQKVDIQYKIKGGDITGTSGVDKDGKSLDAATPTSSLSSFGALLTGGCVH